MSAPANGVIETNTTVTTAQGTTFDATPVTVSGSYGQFKVPAALQSQSTESPRAPTLQEHLFSYQDTTSWRLTVTVTDVSNTAHQYSSSYQLRLDHPEQYTLSQQTISGNTYNVMTDTSIVGFNKVAFETRAGKEVAISLYGNGPQSSANLATTFTMVLGSWLWL